VTAGEASGSEAYVVAHVHDALATDGRVAELGIEVTRTGSTLVLLGRVASTAQREAATVVAAEHAPGFEIRNELEVVDHDTAPAPPERLR
jgi:osmotically-inducible protein OsmY